MASQRSFLLPYFLEDMAPSLTAPPQDFLPYICRNTAHGKLSRGRGRLRFVDELTVCSRGSATELLPLDSNTAKPEISLRLWVDSGDSTGPPWRKPYLRGLGDMVFAGFDARSSLLADLAARNVIGRFSAAMARDTKYWRSTIFPMLLSIIAGSVGIVELHASCVATEEQGLIFIGPSRSGKSTIAMALVNAGFRLLSDDRVFCSLHDGKPLAYGLPRPLKLRRDAGAWFEEWKDREPTDVQNGENVFFWNSDRAEGQGAPGPCIPQALIFLEREDNAGFRLARSTEAKFDLVLNRSYWRSLLQRLRSRKKR